MRKRIHPTCNSCGNSVADRKRCLCGFGKWYRAKQQRDRRRLDPKIAKRNNLRQYGLTHEQWEEMVAKQGNKCAVCDQREVGKNQHGLMALAVDHDHLTGKVRALLCHRCNRALGLLGDSAARVQALADYRRSF